MKLVRIQHTRCSDYDGASIVLAPEDWDEDKIESEVSGAQDDYLAQYRKALSDDPGPPFPGFHPQYALHPEMKVGEVDAAFKVEREAYDLWRAQRDETATRFETFLSRRGFVSVWQDEAGAVECEADWGHRHGMSLRYGGAEKEFPSPAALAASDSGQEIPDE